MMIMKVIGWMVMDESWSDIACEFAIDPKDPFAIRASFGGVEWRIARDLLQDGLDRPTGQGDVRVWPAHGPFGALFIYLRAPTGEALIELPRDEMREYLATLPMPVITDEAMDDELNQLLRRDGDGVL